MRIIMTALAPLERRHPRLGQSLWRLGVMRPQCLHAHAASAGVLVCVCVYVCVCVSNAKRPTAVVCCSLLSEAAETLVARVGTGGGECSMLWA